MFLFIMLQLKNIIKEYNVGSGDVTALDGVTLSFRNSEFVSVLGPSGCGKTTLLNIIGGLDRYTSGDLIINGISTKNYKDADWDTYRNHSIGFVFQSYNLIPHQSVLSNVELALTLSGVSKKERKRRSIEALEKVGLGDQINKKPNQMSGGQMQRVAIARALVNDPDILLADEPTGALDTTTSVQIMELLKEIAEDKLVIMVTHNPEIAETYSSRIVRLRDGKVVGDSDEYGTEQADSDAAALVKAAKHEESSKTRAQKKAARKAKGKKSMSIFTALSLSLNNLMTKKGRTFMTSFAGSIGIIGIALILALSTGVQTYIDDVQKDTLSSYPITIQNEELDLSSIMLSMQGNTEAGNDHELDAVYADTSAYDMFNTLFSQETKKNNLKAFKEWIEKELDPDTAKTDFAEYASVVHYQYNVNLNTYVKNDEGKYVSTSMSGILSTDASSVSTGDTEAAFAVQMSAAMGTVSMWQEILPGKNGELISDMIKEQFEIVDGDWPKSADQVVMVISEDNEVNDLAFYTLGKMTSEELKEIMMSAAQQTPIENEQRVASYEEILGTKFKLVLDAEYYADNDGDGVWSYIGDDDTLMELVVKNGFDVEISGIIKPKEGVTATALSGPFGYTSALTEYIIDKTNETDIAKAQTSPENENFDVLTGLPFVVDEKDLSDAEKAVAFKDYMNSLDAKGKTELFTDILSTPSEEDLKAAADEQMAGLSTREDIVNLMSTQYGLSAEMVESYISAYTEDELFDLVRSEAEKMVLTMYEQKAAEEIEKIMCTPSEEELSSLSAMILANLPTKDLQIGYICGEWTADTAMTQEAVIAYLSSLDDAAFGAVLSDTVNKTAAEQYAGVVTSGTDAGYEKAAAAFDALYLSLDDETQLAAMYDLYMPSGASLSTLEDNYDTLGIADKLTPDIINIYPDTFEDKDAIADLISTYNASVENEEDEISYTDYMALLMSGVTNIINAVSYGLIAFVSISLVVSSIMIGIITYISVLERTKEIGILRAIGASKKDITRVFNAETVIVGFTAGMIGIGISLLLCIPINLIIRVLSGVSVINAQLPVAACVILVVISMVLTVVAGLFPAKVAAKKDPVVALRTE